MMDVKEFIDNTASGLISNTNDLRFRHDLILAKQDPKGQRMFLYEIKFEILKNLNDENTIGHNWIDNNFPDPLKIREETGMLWIENFIDTWIQVDCIKYITENDLLIELRNDNFQIIENVKEKLWESNHEYRNASRLFLTEYFYIQTIENYIKTIEHSPQSENDISNKPKKTFKLRSGVDKEIVIGYYNWLNDNSEIDNTQAEFEAIFSNDKLSYGWKPIKYLRTYKEKPHRTALGAIIRELTTVTKGKNQENYLKEFFVDEHGEHIIPILDQSPGKREEYLMGSNDLKKYITISKA